MAQTSNLGYPRIGRQRELKRAIERYWAGKAEEDEVREVAAGIRAAAWQVQLDAGIDHIPCNDFTYYDHMLDMSCVLGLVPERFGHTPGEPVSLATYSAMARGGDDAAALEMTKWFDTNYHYLVPEFNGPAPVRTGNAPVDAYREAREAVGDRATPVLVGPFTFVLLGKYHQLPIAEHVRQIVPIYQQLLADLAAAGAEWVQIDEPCLVQDRAAGELALFAEVYGALAASSARPKIMLQTYFGSLGSSWDAVMALPVDGIGLDLVRTPGNQTDLLGKGFPADKVLNAGVVNGRGVWRTNLDATLGTLERIVDKLGRKDGLAIGPSCSLLFLPHDVRLETSHDAEVLADLSFADQRLEEISTLAKGLNEGREAIRAELDADRVRIDARQRSDAHHAGTQERLRALTAADAQRATPFADRIREQQGRLGLPAYPTTTIGSFPQSGEVRSMRARLRSGRITAEEYDTWVKSQMDDLIRRQEEIGLDVLVHGEFERTDMVEYFAEQLGGFIATEHGWVQSYGSRCVRPPIIVGDVYRPHPMTVATSTYAQSRTSRPMKGMLTGPVTILNWSFVREDLSRAEVANQIALALRDEVLDLETAGIGIVQIDEPALREGLPLRRAEWQEYLDWAVHAFRLASSGVQPGTQIHTHMCYSEFNDIIDAIAAMDADVISIENSRSNEELLKAFTDNKYEREIGPGVYDVHSPQIPETGEMVERLRNATRVLGAEHLWVNPDCGLKTRGNAEVWPSLTNMVAAAKDLRKAAS
ncbi:MAG TPA: 5-methyltetrahydropteroyltriglutamate--homocysteine S-methyltransferase [Chloroflexi bacterium]|nr:5-methyltetrahydropteroyltriglutamate--homocysteine S-methyltransferase [Chloroflexota bacterium]HBY44850.1 5-methyltetrahydropteroyltriglutamate--homocysteine S-methyltransferase [Chloroflexota bacterium]